MAGIQSYGAYVPPTRLPLSVIGGGKPKDGGPERSVAWNDEDAVTMGVAAALNCLRGFDRGRIDALLFASTTYPFAEKQGAALIARALDLRRDIETVDFAGSLRAGTAALRAATEKVQAGAAKNVLVIVSDARLAAPLSPLEKNLGDAAAAFWVGDQNVIAEMGASYTVADELLDLWRTAQDRFVHTWEERFVVQEGYTPCITEAVQGLCDRANLDPAAFQRVALYGPDARSHATAVRKLRLVPSAVQEPFFGRLGNTGASFAPLLLIAALEQAKPGENILLANYGDGADATVLRTTENIEKLDARRGLSWHLERRRPVASYDQYLRARSLTASEWDAGENPGLSATIHFRERDEDLSFRGQRCGKCSAVQFPMQRVCETCFAKDDFESIRLSDLRGKIVTFTFDYFFPTPQPPTIVTITEIEGARVHLQLVNCTAESTRIDLPVEFVFRKIHEVGGRPNYYWKASPIE